MARFLREGGRKGETIPDTRIGSDRRQTRRELLRNYLRLQRHLVDASPSSSEYQVIIHAFRQLGLALITSGFEDDFDRLLRLRVLEGGLDRPARRDRRRVPEGLLVMERRRG
jgi:hypothetical protein